MPKSKKVRKNYRAKRRSLSEAILGVRMAHDTRWSIDGEEYAEVSILVPAGSVYAPPGIHTKRWVPLGGRQDLHAKALANFQAREFVWRVHTWVLASPPAGDDYVEHTDFETDGPVQITYLEDMAARAKTENYNAINPQHFVAQGWTAETVATNNKKAL